MDEFENALAGMDALIESMKCAILGSVDSSGNPLSSYAPVYIDEQRCFYVYISSMAKHTSQIRKSSKASVMLIEDEAAAENLFARKRLTVDCRAEVIERDTEDWVRVMKEMGKRHGETMASLKDYIDFDLFRLVPSSGRLVLGFGQAYDVSGESLRKIGYVGGGGHRTK